MLVISLLLGVNLVQSRPAAATTEGCTGNWSVFPNLAPRGSRLYDVAAVSLSDVWAVGYRWRGPLYAPMAEHWDGSGWTVMDLPGPSDTDAILFGVSAVASNDVWAVGYFDQAFSQSLVEHWDGFEWSIVPSPNPSPFRNQLFGVAAIGADDVWAVGDAANDSGDVSLILHWDGRRWDSVHPPNLGRGIDHLEAVAAVASDDVWAVGQWTTGYSAPAQALTLHWDGSMWTWVEPVPHQPTSNVLGGASAISSTEVIAVGQLSQDWGTETLTISWDGARWIRSPSDQLRHTSHFLENVSADAAGGAWAVGYYIDSWPRTEIQQWDGSAWHLVRSPNDGAISYLEGVIMISADEAWAVGQGTNAALIEHYCAGGTAQISQAS
jgi:hypothetical protein